MECFFLVFSYQTNCDCGLVSTIDRFHCIYCYKHLSHGGVFVYITRARARPYYVYAIKPVTIHDIICVINNNNNNEISLILIIIIGFYVFFSHFDFGFLSFRSLFCSTFHVWFEYISSSLYLRIVLVFSLWVYIFCSNSLYIYIH